MCDLLHLPAIEEIGIGTPTHPQSKLCFGEGIRPKTWHCGTLQRTPPHNLNTEPHANPHYCVLIRRPLLRCLLTRKFVMLFNDHYCKYMKTTTNFLISCLCIQNKYRGSVFTARQSPIKSQAQFIYSLPYRTSEYTPYQQTGKVITFPESGLCIGMPLMSLNDAHLRL